MRRLASALVLLAASCTSSTPEPSTPSQNPLQIGVGLEAATVLETARAFVEAYRDPRTVAAKHRSLVFGEDLQEWARWTGVQNNGLDFVRRGEVHIRVLRFAAIEEPYAAVELDATIELRRREGGDILEHDRRFTSPMVLGDVEGVGWRVLDVVRDARPMGASIVVLDPPVTVTEGPARVEVASVFRFTQGTVVNVLIENRGDTPLRVDAERTLISLGGQPAALERQTTSLVGPIAPGTTTAGGLTFPEIPLNGVPDGVAIRFLGDRRPLDVAVGLPTEPFVLQPQSASNSSGVGVSSP